MPRIRIATAALLCFAGVFLSLLLLSKHYGVPLFGEAILAACGVNEGCDVVAQSRYSSLMGLPLAAWGVLFYGSLLALLAPSALSSAEDNSDGAPSLGFFLVALAIVLDLGLLGLQAFVIKAFCKFCLATYVVNILMLVSLWPFRQVAQATNFLFVSRNRRSVVAWLVATLAVGASAFAGNTALADRKALAGTSILGVPSMLQAPESSDPQDPLVQARAEAKKWKDTLDSPPLLQEYLTQKAKDDFNRSAAVNIDLTRSPSQGAAKGPIVVVSFSDFMCPYCRDLAQGLTSFMKQLGAAGSIKLHFKQFPLDTECNPSVGRTVHPGACELAKASICASDQGRFWEFHDKVFSRQWEKATREDAISAGVSVGLDRAQLTACLDHVATKGRLSADIEEGGKLGVGATPTVFVNGHQLQSTSVFLLAVEEERKRLNLPPFVPTPPQQGR